MTEIASFRFELRHDPRDPLLPWQWWAVFANGEEIYRAGFSNETAAREFSGLSMCKSYLKSSTGE